MKGTGAKLSVCPGSYVSTGAKFPVAPVESAPMNAWWERHMGVSNLPRLLTAGEPVGWEWYSRPYLRIRRPNQLVIENNSQ